MTFKDGYDLGDPNRRCEWCNGKISGPGNRLRICESCRRNSISQGIAFRKSLPPQTGPVGPIIPQIGSEHMYVCGKRGQKRVE